MADWSRQKKWKYWKRQILNNWFAKYTKTNFKWSILIGTFFKFVVWEKNVYFANCCLSKNINIISSHHLTLKIKFYLTNNGVQQSAKFSTEMLKQSHWYIRRVYHNILSYSSTKLFYNTRSKKFCTIVFSQTNFLLVINVRYIFDNFVH